MKKIGTFERSDVVAIVIFNNHSVNKSIFITANNLNLSTQRIHIQEVFNYISLIKESSDIFKIIYSPIFYCIE